MKKLLYGTGYLDYNGKPGVDPVRKSGLALCMRCVGSQAGHLSITGATQCERAVIPTVKASGLGESLPSSLSKGQTEKFP